MSNTVSKEDRPGLVGSRYQILNELGRGRMGVVYRAVDRLTGRVITLKRLQTDLGAAAPDSASRLDLAREFSLLASLRHPNIIGVLDYGFDESERPYFTMDLMEGARGIIGAGQNRPPDVQVDLLVQALRAIAYVHRRGIVHRDIKGANLVVVEGEVKLLDFGLSMKAATPDAPAESVSGTLAYLAPELFAGSAPDRKTDLFAFGIVMYEMLAGRHPFDPDDRLSYWHRLTTEPPPLPVDGVDPRLEGVILRLLAKRPEDRFANATEVIPAMARALERELPAETVASRESFLQAASFVGRTSEMKLLTDALDDACAGHGATCLIGGESGVGKSRLLEELRCLALVRGVTIARGQVSATASEPYEIWREVARTLVLAAPAIGDRLASDLKPLVDDIEGLIGRPVADPAVDTDGAQTRLLLAVEELLRMQRRPVAILLEDLQWIGSASLKLLVAATRAAAGASVLIVGAFRNDEGVDLAASVPGACLLRLSRLDAQETGELAASMIGTAGNQARVVDFLLGQTEGIPFFLVELVRSMAEEAGSLQRIVLQEPLAAKMPGGTQRLLRRRLSRVPSSARASLEVAAVIGRDLDPALLGFVEPDLPVADWCTECVVVGVFEAQEDRYRFAHDKLREQVLLDLSEDRKRFLHRRVAEAIERTRAESHRHFPALAHHWGAAGEPTREATACESAGIQALQSGACVEATKFFGRAIEILGAGLDSHDRTSRASIRRLDGFLDPNLAVAPEDPAFRVACLEVGLTESFFRLGDFGACRSHALRAMSLSGIEMPTAFVKLGLGIGGQAVRRMLQVVLRFRSTDADSAAVAREMVRVLAYLYEVCFFALEPGGLLWSVLAMANHCAPFGPGPALARAHMALALVAGAVGVHPLARRWCASSLAIAREACTPSELGYLLNRVNNYRFACCDWETADREISLAGELAEQTGDRRILEEAKAMQGMSALFQGRFEQGVRLWSEVQGLSERSGNPQIECWALMGRADNLVRLGRDGEAVTLYTTAIERFADRAHATESIWAHGMLALASMRTGDDAAALKHARESLRLLTSARPMAYWTQFGTAATLEVFLSLAERSTGPGAQQGVAFREMERARRAMREFAHAFPMGRPFWLLYEGRYRWLRGHRRLAIRRWGRCIELAESLGMPYELGCALLEKGRRLPADSQSRRWHLEKALEVLRECGAAREFAVVQALLESSGDRDQGQRMSA